jgi:LPXTG-site transpeptidase (sortase) family protein
LLFFRKNSNYKIYSTMKKILTGGTILAIVILGFFVQSVFACNQEIPPDCRYADIHTIGYWKNHEEVYLPLLPVSLGSDQINTQEQVDAVFDNANAKEMSYMLKAQLLALKFNIAEFGVGDYIYQDKTINQIVAEADASLQDSSATRDDLETIKNTLDRLNNLGQVLICPSVPIYGCTDPTALNYDPTATIDDGSCEYEPPVEIPGCTDPEALNYDPGATIEDGSCQYSEPDTFSISGMKFNDENNNGINEQEPGLPGWVIKLYVSDQVESLTVTDTNGTYSFLNLDPGTYTLCEYIEVEGWVQTYPVDNDGCHNVEIVDQDIAGIDFGNHYQQTPPGETYGCTDPEALNYDQAATVDDGSCQYAPPGEIYGCTDLKAINYNPQATVDNGSCEYNNGGGGGGGGGGVRPRFSIDKTASKNSANAGETISYTIVVECLGSGVAINTILKDSLPEGFSYKDSKEDGEWDLGEMIRGDTKTITFDAVISSDQKPGKYVNTATVKADNSDEYKDSAEVEVLGIGVKGGSFLPKLQIEKSVNKNTAKAGSYVIYTIKVTNSGQAPAVNAVVEDDLPEGFITEDGKSEIIWNIPLLREGESWTQSLNVYIGSNVPDGKYENTATAYAENNPEKVKDTALVTLGILPHTAGSNPWSFLMDLVITPVKKSASISNYLVIPKIGVEIPIVQGSSESALERGAWLLPQTNTPDLLKNTALAAHRYKYLPPNKKTFYSLDKISQGDELLVYWKGKKYVYSVSSISVVDPTDTEVLADTGIPTLTLITCYPLYSDAYRLIVQGTLVI